MYRYFFSLILLTWVSVIIITKNILKYCPDSWVSVKKKILNIPHLGLGEFEAPAELQPLGHTEVLISLELSLQGPDLGGCEGGAGPLLALLF